MPQQHLDDALQLDQADGGRSVAAALKETLESLGVEYLFGMESPPALHAELSDGGIRVITIRDERSGAFMADGYAKVSGKPGVCGVAGVGATNMVQGVVESYLSSTPVVILVEEGSGTTRYRNDLQDIERGPIFASITKWVCQLEDPARVSELIARGFRVATTGRPGPVYIGCPWDVFSGNPADAPWLAAGESVYPACRVAPDPQSVEDVARLLRSSKRPVIVAGGGVLISGAEAELAAFARTLDAPVAVTPNGKGSIDEEDALFAGVVGSYASGTGGSGVAAHEIVRSADLVVLLGTSTGSGSTANWTLPAPEQEIIHIDIDPVEIGRNYPRSVPLVGDAKLAMRALLTALDGRADDAPTTESWASRLLVAAQTARATGRRSAAAISGGRGVDPESMFAELQTRIDERTRIVCDAGYCTAWALDRLRLSGTGRRFLGPFAYGTLGYGLPAAIGAKLADPESTVVCLSGDGGIGYSLGELETAARHGVALTAIVFNNASLAWSRHYNRQYYGYEGSTDFSDVDYGAVARGLGCEGVHVATADDFADALDKALGSDVTTLIDVEVDPEARPAVDMFG
jgi:acetolactate synthase I/II/III large subunit